MARTRFQYIVLFSVNFHIYKINYLCILIYMSKTAKTVSSSPKQVQHALEKLGADLRIARLRRGESLRSWAQRVGVSVPTLQRMEAGDPSVGVSVYTMALWLVGKINDLANLADPAGDEQALAIELAKLPKGRT